MRSRLNAQMMDILKNALGGQSRRFRISMVTAIQYNNYGSGLNGAGSTGLSGLLGQFLPWTNRNQSLFTYKSRQPLLTSLRLVVDY